MIDRESVQLAYQRKRGMRPDAARFMRPDAQRYIRPDVARFLSPGAYPADVFLALNVKYSPTQRRIPAGRTGGGRWTNEAGGGGGSGGSGIFAGGGGAAGEDGAVEAIGVDATGIDVSDTVMAFDEVSPSDAWTDLIGDETKALLTSM